LNRVESQEKTHRRDRPAIVADVREALVRVLEEKPFNDVTVDELAREAGLSRTAFYFYYRDKSEVLTAVLEELAKTAHADAAAWWSGEGDPETMIRDVLHKLGALWTTPGGVLRAAVEAAAYDPAFMRVYHGLVEDFIRPTQEHLRRERDAGKLRHGVDPDSRAEALIWMSERYHYVGMLRGREPGPTAEVLTSIWLNALYADGAAGA
jgi:AcrR family transcriptional regulator